MKVGAFGIKGALFYFSYQFIVISYQNLTLDEKLLSQLIKDNFHLMGYSVISLCVILLTAN